MAAAIAEAARKRAAKLGIQNEEVDEANMGKTKDGTLKNPYLSKVEKAPPLSPRSRRLAEMRGDGGGEGGGKVVGGGPAAAPR
eukprot:CAMPEP_0173388742 /NCGR_PEP_ID=MMETSP1356-20130122/10981_1 /TAXON_ID=77927 ORGANISM="Hemiselmis virescens, Strain PCC157" /NCGR_SAMPLE_ID=MMETSP1356 /ASSEMBLY_ACC=CAM_ASM_000847 /LENGTH=82 /DNA_ID=CAMNT_0014345729 /DNA_START=63 /DNA_END=307 /DNA_ORIENTATION=+